MARKLTSRSVPGQSRHGFEKSDGTYRLRRFLWRSCLTFVGPWLVFGFYAYISFGFLIHPPSNDVLLFVKLSGTRWIYYVWFLIAVFVPDLSRTALTNIEAAALMQPRLAPPTAIGLLWHTDSKWANPLWWLRALQTAINVILHRRSKSPHHVDSGPTVLWAVLGFTTLLIYVALPLSGLTMELSNVSTRGGDLAKIFGPGAVTFNDWSKRNAPDQVRNRWSSGQQTTPPQGTLLYAPNGTPNVNLTYFNDLVTLYASNVEFFAGPTVHEPVVGKAWGMYANISCNPVASSQLQMLRVNSTGYSVRSCSYDQATSACNLSWQDGGEWIMIDTYGYKPRPVYLPAQLIEHGDDGNNVSWTYLAAADGYSYIYGNQTSPYAQDSNHDNMTFDAIEGFRLEADVTTAMFEIYFIESYGAEDMVLTGLVNGTYPGPVDIWTEDVSDQDLGNSSTTSAGLALHCDITTTVGNAELNPSHRTFSSFEHSKSASGTKVLESSWTIYNQLPSQMVALIALGGNTESAGTKPGYPHPWDGEEYSPVWQNLHTAAGLLQPPESSAPNTTEEYLPYSALTPKNLQLAIYKLLGESVIAVMDEGGITPWEGELYLLKSTSYLVPGVVPWEYVLILLGIWALILSGGEVWATFFAGPRWAASLDGFEMFKFGAQYPDTIDLLSTVDFRSCSNALRQVPGMVGMLPGKGRATDAHAKLGFIGLSENVASKDVIYTLDRGQAAATRPP